MNDATATSNKETQRGSVLVMTAGVILVALALLGTLQVAYTFYMKRALQNAADLAAISGAQALPAAGGTPDCALAVAHARAILGQNLTNSAIADQALLECGEWTPAETIESRFMPGGSTPNAVRVEVNYAVPVLVPFVSNINALTVDAIALNTLARPVAAFSVGPRLLGLDPDDGILPEILTFLGLQPEDVSLISHRGLADVHLTPSGLLQQLDLDVPLSATIADMDSLLDAEASIAEILDAAISVADDKGFLSAEQLNVLNTILTSFQVDDVLIRLFSTPDGERGLFSLSANLNDPAGLDAAVRMPDVLEVLIAAASKSNGLSLALETGRLLDENNPLRPRVSVHAGIIEPPSIGIGPEGTTAHSAGIRILVRVWGCVSTDGCTEQEKLLAKLLPIGVDVDLPILLEAASGTGTLGQMCHVEDSGTPLAEITAEPALLSTCVGNFSTDPSDPNYAFSTSQSCVQQINSNPETLSGALLNVNLKLPLLPPGQIIGVRGPLSPITMPTMGTTADFRVGETKELGDGVNLQATLESVLESVVGTLANTVLLTPGLETPNSAQRLAIAEELWERAKEAGPSCDVSQSNCRRTISQRVTQELEAGGETLRTLDGVDAGLLGSLLTLLDSIGALLGSLLNNIIGVLHNPCTGGLLGGGSESGCIGVLADSQLLKDRAAAGQINIPAILLPLLGFIIETLSPILNAIVSLLENTLNHTLLDTLGLNLGQVETTLISLDCEGQVRLVH